MRSRTAAFELERLGDLRVFCCECELTTPLIVGPEDLRTHAQSTSICISSTTVSISVSEVLSSRIICFIPIGHASRCAILLRFTML